MCVYLCVCPKQRGRRKKKKAGKMKIDNSWQKAERSNSDYLPGSQRVCLCLAPKEECPAQCAANHLFTHFTIVCLVLHYEQTVCQWLIMSLKLTVGARMGVTPKLMKTSPIIPRQSRVCGFPAFIPAWIDISTSRHAVARLIVSAVKQSQYSSSQRIQPDSFSTFP